MNRTSTGSFIILHPSSCFYGVKPEPPEGRGGDSTLPLKRGTRTTGTSSGISAKGETGRWDEATGGPPMG